MANMTIAETLRIGDVAALTGVNIGTIRNLERRGLLNPARDWAGQRRFTQRDVAAIRRLAGLATADEETPGCSNGATGDVSQVAETVR